MATKKRRLTGKGKTRTPRERAPCAGEHEWTPRLGGGFLCLRCPAFSVGDVGNSAASPAQPSALESVREVLAVLRQAGISAKRGTPFDADHLVQQAVKGFAALDSLVSEVRAEERKRCIADAETIRAECERNSTQATADNLVTAWHDAAAGAKRVEDAIRARGQQ